MWLVEDEVEVVQRSLRLTVESDLDSVRAGSKGQRAELTCPGVLRLKARFGAGDQSSREALRTQNSVRLRTAATLALAAVRPVRMTPLDRRT